MPNRKDFITTCDDFIRDNNIQFNNELKHDQVWFERSGRPGVCWKTYLGPKKCVNCDHTADFESQNSYACKDCVMKI